MSVPFFEDANALDSLRSSDFDSYSAYGEVIDNALQAGAENIAISFQASPGGRKANLEAIVFADDGIGMTPEVLASCLKLGWSSRFNDRSGIGRFGVGMILGAIHECKRVEVYSRTEGSEAWYSTYVDLDEIAEKSLQAIPAPREAVLPPEYAPLLPLTGSGTVVIWSKHDRQKVSVEKLISETHLYVGRTFRYFIWDGIKISVDGDPIKAHDPLYRRVDKTMFPDDPVGREYPEMKVDWPVESGLQDQFGETSQITIKTAILPLEFRPKRGAGGSEVAKQRQINELQQGISILRERREVFFGLVPYWSSVRYDDDKKNQTWSFEELDRWWGCEVHFGAELDSSFEVKNIKRGARPEPELLSVIKQLITPTRDSVLEQVRDVWKKVDAQEAAARQKEQEDLNRHGGHASAEKAAAKGVASRSKFNAEMDPEKAESEAQDGYLSRLERQQQSKYLALFKEQPYTIVDDHQGWKGGTFWDVFIGGDKIMMSYNLQHAFFTELRALEERLEGETDADRLKEHSLKVTTLVDLLLISFAKAQAMFDKDQEVQIEQVMEQLNNYWGQNLKSFTLAWREDND